MPGKTRLSKEERKARIIDAAKPLFAEKGFNGTSVRDIAKVAQVSEALLYRHFPSKEAMYREILSYPIRLSGAALRGIRDLEPGTRTLVLLVYALFQIILFESPGRGEEQKIHERLLFYSLLEDNNYARLVFKGMFDSFNGILRDSFAAAAKAGDIARMPVNLENRFWFVHHLGMALNLCHLSATPAFKYAGTKQGITDDAIMFALRGIGLTDEAIRKHFKPSTLRADVKKIFAQ